MTTRLFAICSYLLAGMTVCAGTSLWLATRLAPRFNASEDLSIGVALAVYAVCLVGVVGAVLAPSVAKAAWGAHSRTCLAASWAMILGYVFWVTLTVAAVLRSTDL